MEETSIVSGQFEVLEEIVATDHCWPTMMKKYGVENPLPPWKTSLDGICDALDHSDKSEKDINFNFKQRRDEEDILSGSHYSNLSFPENQLVSLAHSLLARGVISESELRKRLELIRMRLEE